MKIETCLHGGVAPINMLQQLHQSQAGTGRHRCPTCAYEFGYSLGSTHKWNDYSEYLSSLDNLELETCNSNSKVPTIILSKLGENQGGPGRHKCCNCAFVQGFEDGLDSSIKKQTYINFTPVPTSEEAVIKKNITTQVDYVERELRNRKIGYLGEIAILNSEIKQLEENGKPELAKQVIHVSEEIGDGLGYDILSFDVDGNEKKIEVKTTRSDKNRPFFISKNELEVSKQETETYFLYRLYNFDTNSMTGDCYILKGNINENTTLDPLTFLAYPTVTF
jgi:hypothetical protein